MLEARIRVRWGCALRVDRVEVVERPVKREAWRGCWSVERVGLGCAGEVEV